MNCLHRPAQARFLLVFDFYFDICNGNQCAAALLAFFAAWHDAKLRQREQAKTLNDLEAESGHARSQREDLLQVHTEEELERGVMFFKRRSFPAALAVLTHRGYISTHSNPDPKFKFDRRRFFLFHPEVVNRSIRDYLRARKNASDVTQNCVNNNLISDLSNTTDISSRKNAPRRKTKDGTLIPDEFRKFEGVVVEVVTEMQQALSEVSIVGADEHQIFVARCDRDEQHYKNWRGAWRTHLTLAIKWRKEKGVQPQQQPAKPAQQRAPLHETMKGRNK